MNRLEKLPVPVLPTLVGAATLSNVYNGIGYSWVRHLTMWAAAIVLICYLIKMIKFPKTCLNEYSNTIPASLYAGFSMLMMILGSYIFDFSNGAGKVIFLAGLCIHTLHLLVFTFRNVIKSRNIQTFLPSWFVTYNGILVSCVVGGAMGINPILTVITYYGIAIYIILIPIMIWRLLKHEIKTPVYHTMAIVLAPCSLCVTAYINTVEAPLTAIVYFLYICVLISLAFVIIKLPKFFAHSFTPSFAGLTFPMAIGIVATTKFAAFTSQTAPVLSNAATQLSGIQIYITSMLVGYVLLNLIMMLIKTKRVIA